MRCFRIIILLWAITLEVLGCTSLQPIFAMTSVNVKSVSESSTSTLGRLAAVKSSRVEIRLDSPYFCCLPEQPNSRLYKFLQRALQDFPSKYGWMLNSYNGAMCLAFADVDGITFHLSSANGLATGSAPSTKRNSEQDKIHELSFSPTFLGVWFDKHRLPIPMEDYYLEPGVHDVWIVKRPDTFWARFAAQEMASDDRELPFGITLQELEAIYSDVFGINSSSGESLESSSYISTFPLLARISDPWDDSWYFPAEIEVLKQEIERADAIVGSSGAHTGLAKLKQMCDLALRSESGLYFLAR
jgi:hypothetical protein